MEIHETYTSGGCTNNEVDTSLICAEEEEGQEGR